MLQIKVQNLDSLKALEIRKAICKGKHIVNDITDLKKSPMSDNLIPFLVY